jgi:hypothetical protein
MNGARRLCGVLFIAIVLCCYRLSAARADGPSGGAPRAAPAPTQPLGLTGKTLIYHRTSLIDDLANGLSDKLNLDYGFAHGQGFDLRAEYYKDGSFNEQPPFQIPAHSTIYEPKLEYQLTYSMPVSRRLFFAVAALHHHNFRFEDAYYWGIASLTYAQPITSALQLSITGSAEKRLASGGLFYDGVATLDQQLGPTLKFETTVHRYQNWGELDPSPTDKIEIETGFIKNLTDRQSIWVSFLRHYQNGAPNDAFSVLQLKYGVAFGRGANSP